MSDDAHARVTNPLGTIVRRYLFSRAHALTNLRFVTHALQIEDLLGYQIGCAPITSCKSDPKGDRFARLTNLRFVTLRGKQRPSANQIFTRRCDALHQRFYKSVPEGVRFVSLSPTNGPLTNLTPFPVRGIKSSCKSDT